MLRLQRKYPNNYIYKCLDDNVDNIICYVKDFDNPSLQWKIALTDEMVIPTIKWFHKVMGHPGQTRLNKTLRQRYHHHKLQYHIERFRCKHCQRHKLPGKGYGLLPERELRIVPWEEVTVNLVEPWHIKIRGREVEFKALTCIDMDSNLVELIQVDNKTSDHVRDKFS